MFHRLLAAEEGEGREDRRPSTEWRRWRDFANSIGQDPYLRGLQGKEHQLEREYLFLAFARALREGVLNGGKSLSGETVARTLRYCGQKLAERGFADPRKESNSQDRLNRRIANYLKQCKEGDPAPVPQQALLLKP